MEKSIQSFNLLIGKSERKVPTWRPRHTLENNIKMVIKETGCQCVDWFQMAGYCEDNERLGISEPADLPSILNIFRKTN